MNIDLIRYSRARLVLTVRRLVLDVIEDVGHRFAALPGHVKQTVRHVCLVQRLATRLGVRLAEHDVLLRRHAIRLAWNLVLEAAADGDTLLGIGDRERDEFAKRRRNVHERLATRHHRGCGERSDDEKSKRTH